MTFVAHELASLGDSIYLAEAQAFRKTPRYTTVFDCRPQQLWSLPDTSYTAPAYDLGRTGDEALDEQLAQLAGKLTPARGGRTLPCGCTVDRTVLRGDENAEGPPDPNCVVCSGRGRMHLKFQRLSSIPVTTAEHLFQGGWSIQETSTGRPKGRPTTGITDTGAILVRLRQHKLRDFLHLRELQSSERGPVVYQLVEHDDVNRTALARDASYARSTILRTVTQQKAPKSEREASLATATAQAVIERLDRIERLEAMRAETIDSVRLTVERLAERFCDDEAVRRKASEFLEEL